MPAESEPYATIDREGVRVHIPTEGGEEISFVLSLESAHTLILAMVKKAGELATAQGKVKLGISLASWLFK